MKINKLMALVLAVLMVATMLPITAAAAPTATITVGNVTATAGGKAIVDIIFQGNPGITAATLVVTYPAELTLTSVSDNGLLGANVHKPTMSNPYTLCWANDTATTNFTANGTVASLTFQVPAGAAAGTKYPISISYDYENYDIMDKDSNPIQFAVTAGGITVAAPTTTTKRPTTTKKPVTTTRPVIVTTKPVTTTTVTEATTTTTTVETTVTEATTTTTQPATTTTAVLAGVTTGAATEQGGDNNALLWWLFGCLCGLIFGAAITAAVFAFIRKRQ